MSSHATDVVYAKSSSYTVQQVAIDSLIINALLHCALSLAAKCNVIGPVCGFMGLCICGCVCLWVCYHDNSKLRASILTKLGFVVKIVTISS